MSQRTAIQDMEKSVEGIQNKTSTAATYSLGLALSGGGAKGFAHIGVLQYLEDHGLKPDIIAGTSVGALFGALYCDGYSPEEMLDLFSSAKFKRMTDWQIPQRGFFGTSGFKTFLRSILRHKRMQDIDFPLHIIATDLDNGTVKCFRRGPLVEIIAASCSIPVLFNPIRIEGVYYVDGGLFKNLPASIIRDQCKTLIGVHLDPKSPKTYRKNLFSIAERSFDYVFRSNSMPDCALCDILIESDRLTSIRRFDTKNAAKIARLGYQMAEAAMGDILADHIQLESMPALSYNKVSTSSTLN